MPMGASSRCCSTTSATCWTMSARTRASRLWSGTCTTARARRGCAQPTRCSSATTRCTRRWGRGSPRTAIARGRRRISARRGRSSRCAASTQRRGPAAGKEAPMFSQTVEYALRAMAFVAGQGREPVTTEQIAAATRVPAGYLAKIMRDLVVAHLVDSQRGPRGGFTLARPAAEVSILDVVNAVDPVRRIRECPLDNPAHLNLCPLHRRLDNALAIIETALRDSNLAELQAESRASSAAEACRSLTPLQRSAEKKAAG